MLNNPRIERETYGNRKTILVDEFNSTAFSCMVNNTGVTANDEGKKIIKAGTPVAGSLVDRSKPFTVSTSNPVGIILHDVDVTLGNANSQVVVFGFIDETKLDDDVVTMVEAAKDSLKMIQFVK